MSAPDVRTAVEAAIRRHLTARAAPPAAAPAAETRPAPAAEAGPPPAPPAAVPPAAPAPAPPHPSQARFAVPDGASSGGPCVIEPALPCVRSGHCQTRGY